MDDEATKAAYEIWEDLADRAGADDIARLRYDDKAIFLQIIDVWASIIRGAIKDAVS